MAKQPPSSERPSKICPICNKPFTWRKSWRNNWDNVVYCSDRCRSARGKPDKYIVH